MRRRSSENKSVTNEKASYNDFEIVHEELKKTKISFLVFQLSGVSTTIASKKCNNPLSAIFTCVRYVTY